MNKLNWTYLGDNGKQYRIVLFHSPRKGHLVLSCNQKIVLLKFLILKTIDFSFFIEDELCIIHIVQSPDNAGDFSYSFEIDKTANTSKNKRRKKKMKKNILYVILGVIAFFSVLIFFVSSLDNLHKKTLAEELEVYGKYNECTTIIRTIEERTAFVHRFIHKEKYYFTEPVFYDSPFITENGMPLENGDEFTIRYASNNPKNSIVYYKKPSGNQIYKYRNRVMSKYATNHKELKANYIECLTDLFFELKNIEGYAILYFEKAPEEDNEHNNANTFEAFVGSDIFMAKKSSCSE